MIDERPGLNPRRLVDLAKAAVDRCKLDLSGAVVLTEAATGAYVVTPVLAAMAGASRVDAVTRTSSFGTVEEVSGSTLKLARLAGVHDRINIITEKTSEVISAADITTNSGHVRPIDCTMIEQMKPTAVIPLMYEAWEYRDRDLDLDACRRRGIVVAGTNERHPDVDVFSYLGAMAAKLLMDAGVAVRGSRVLLLCDNPFRGFIEGGLRVLGAEVCVTESLPGGVWDCALDAIVVALKPEPCPVFDATGAATVAAHWPGAVVAQLWGDLDREALAAYGVPYWPVAPPNPGQMGILPSTLGPEAVVRLQSGGLKVGQILSAARRIGMTVVQALESLAVSGYGTFLKGSADDAY